MTSLFDANMFFATRCISEEGEDASRRESGCLAFSHHQAGGMPALLRFALFGDAPFITLRDAFLRRFE